MNLKELLDKLETEETKGVAVGRINALSFDSRDVSPDTLFFAVPGEKSDGHDFIDTAIEEGATAIVCERFPDALSSDTTYIRVKSAGQALGEIAHVFHGRPSAKLKLVGVTGTNGKTTTATLLYRLFKSFGRKAGLISTIAVFIDDERRPTSHTTPDALALNALLEEMCARGCEYCFMEVSSHALVQGRVAGLRFAGGIFTNLTHDHLDYHKTFDEYLKAKKLFFDSLQPDAFALTNLSDRNAKVMTQNTRASVHSYAVAAPADFACRILELSFDGMLLNIDGTDVWTRLTGRFNASNLLAVYAAARLLGATAEDTLAGISALTPVEGRVETIRTPAGVTAVVDYAHTPDALKNILDALNDVRDKSSTLVTVVGCGGNRDKTKRPEMARISAANSDKLILTSDNPRFEDPDAILDDMIAGLDEAQLARTLRIVNRREAIKTALALASKGDIVLIAGKGHEDYQETKGVKQHFDDRETVEELAGLNSPTPPDKPQTNPRQTPDKP
ncbi:MAG: UDP-N-acetylmuramoyl-L-alanyl-D-glutamate--2,6-diaminopimelate ligase [Prevotellaceae bacterium]|jgi:UDP-N-acetylmuramoyl-L-alanyl-D-glutamate--2,6-diaminopimelate ligase|nr:UDP-N-acetylmuramoyl-L-alanyl-D-glutamate--2,6-diaminopimelate ligase [Prevotellaceae bacterium]